MKRKIAFGLAIVMALSTLAIGCGKKNESAENTEAKDNAQAEVEISTEVETETEEVREGMLISPFTGLWVDEEVAKQRPIACMIENTAETLPQYGLNSADIIYEFPIEGGTDRFMAVFQDYKNLEKFGNFRSCRLPFIPLAMETGSIYVHCGGSESGLASLATGVVSHLNLQENLAGSFYYTDPDRKAPHHIYLSGERVLQAAEAYEIETTLDENYTSRFLFAKEENGADLSSGEDCMVVDPYYFICKPYFIYDEETQLYYRYEFNEAQVDGNTGEQLCVKNIIVQNVASEYDEDQYYIFTNYTVGGDGYYISNGKKIPITWTKAADYEIPHYYDLEGNEIEINPGRTWICLSQSQYKEKNLFWSTVEEFENRE